MRTLLVLLLLAGPVLADTVITTDGRRIEGTVTERDGKIVIKKKGIEVTLDKSEVERIEVGSTLEDELEKKKAALAPNDADGRYALAQWCKKNGLSNQAKALLEEVIKIAPDHAQARRDLGYIKDGDDWVTEESLRKKLGFEKLNGRWVPAAEAQRARLGEELKKLLVRFALVWPNHDKKAETARSDLEALAAKDPALAGPLIEDRLGEHDPRVRLALVQVLGKVKAKSAASKLVELAFEDDDRDVRLAAAYSAWELEDNAVRTQIVQSLFSPRTVVRDHAAEALGYIEDKGTVPYLIEALYQVGSATVEVEDAPITRGYGAVLNQGVFGGYWIEAGEVHLENRMVFIYSKKALAALKHLTGKDYDYSKHDWFQWWEKEHPRPAPAGPAKQK